MRWLIHLSIQRLEFEPWFREIPRCRKWQLTPVFCLGNPMDRGAWWAVVHCCCLVAQLCPTLCDPMDCSTPGFSVHHELPTCSNSCPSSRWCHPTISSSVAPFSSCLESFPASGSFLRIQLFTSDGQSTGASASASVLLINSQDWSPLGLTNLISLQFKGLSRIFSNTTVQKHQFFSMQPFLWSSSYIHTWLLEKNHHFDYMDLCLQSNVSAF